jgi:methyltransferase
VSIVWIVLLVAVQRLLELQLSRANEVRLRAAGAIERGAAHYPLFVLLHTAWLVALLVAVPWNRPGNPWLLGAFFALQPLRYWCIRSLGGRWTTRVLVLHGAPRVRHGPYRWLRHPNYLIVALEIALLPLAYGAIRLALGFSLANALLLAWRIRVEERALRSAEALTVPAHGSATPGRGPPAR